jgi:hypothetical protein
MNNKQKKSNTGPKPDNLKIDEENWEIAVKKAILKKKPKSGWPNKDKTKDS